MRRAAMASVAFAGRLVCLVALVASNASGRTYYWIIFSSTRSGNPQLYVAAVVKDETGLVTTTPALYLWNQPAAENNHTPAWDTFSIPLN